MPNDFDDDDRKDDLLSGYLSELEGAWGGGADLGGLGLGAPQAPPAVNAPPPAAAPPTEMQGAQPYVAEVKAAWGNPDAEREAMRRALGMVR